MQRLTLNGPWTLTRLATGATCPATAPGVVHTDLMTAGIIGRPHYRDNEAKYVWIGREEWAYTRTFDAGADTVARRAQKLVFEGLDTFARVTLNGVPLGETENMFRRYEFNVAGLLREGANELEVAFASPQAVANRMAADLPFAIPYGDEKNAAGRTDRNLIRKCQCHGGWDWGPAFLASGIWRDVYLAIYDDLKIDYIKPLQTHQDGRAVVKTMLYLDVALAGTYDIMAALAGVPAATQERLPEGKSVVEIELALEGPKLWWPLGYGEQTLHTLEVSISIDGRPAAQENIRLGLRQVELVQEEDEHGRSFFFKINGVPIFLKGYNWIPADSFTSRITREVYADLIDSAALAHCNVLRVWGGGIYEHEDFYELCDERGILIWHDFMFACAMYPWDDAFLANVAGEVRHQLRRLARHPSLMLWCGNNECEQALGWYEEVKANRDRYTTGYYKLYIDTIGRLTGEELPDVPFWPSSASNGPEEWGDPNDTARGDTHYWEVWHGNKRFSAYLDVAPRMSSEFGFQSVPSRETLLTVMEPEDLNISSPMMDYHQRSWIGNKAMAEHMMYEYRLPLDFDKFVYLSQVQQALAMKTAVEHWRRIKPVNMGTIIWQLNDIWPGNSWSSIEYGGKWKVLHSFAKRFYAPLLLSLAKRERRVEVWATSDLLSDIEQTYRLEVWNFSGEVLRSWDGRFALGAGESKNLLTLAHDELRGDLGLHEIFLVLRGGDEGDGLFNWEFLVPAKFCPLPEAKIACRVEDMGEQIEFVLASDKPAFHVWLEMPGRKGVFDDNGFLMLPGVGKRVRFRAKEEKGSVGGEGVRVAHLREMY